jgi:distribution and morphology protein 10
LTNIAAQSDRIPLSALLRSYRHLHGLGSRDGQWCWEAGDTPNDATQPAVTTSPPNTTSEGSTLLYGRLYLPQSLLEALFVRRLNPNLQLQLSAVSERSLRNGGTILGLVQYDKGKYGVEGLVSTDGGMLGIRGLYNFGGDTSPASSPGSSVGSVTQENGGNGQQSEKERIYGRFSAGGEVYYGTLNKSGGMSLGARFATLPAHRGTPLTATLTINPLMGNINATYAVLARDYCSLATRMEFNVYSYESEWAVGMELWSNRKPAGFLLGADPRNLSVPEPGPLKKKERSFQAKLEWRLDDEGPKSKTPEEKPAAEDPDEYRGVLKARMDHHLRLGVLWEGRAKSLIFSLGTGIDLRKLDEPFRSLGLAIQYSS